MSGAARSSSAPQAWMKDDLAGKRLLDGITLDFGPTDLLGRFFLKADAALRERGIEITFGTLDELVAVNKKNSASWRPLISIFDPALGGIDSSNSFVMFGRNRAGDIVATQAARLYRWTNTNFAEEARSLRLFYPDPDRQKLSNEELEVTARMASEITGRVSLSGAVWVAPAYRGRFLTGIMPRICRAFAFTHWYTDMTAATMDERLVTQKLAERCGYRDIDHFVHFRNTRLGDMTGAVLRLRTAQMLDDLADFGKLLETQVDRRIENRAG